jgi:hypothetical protein
MSQEVESTLRSLNKKWDIEVGRLREYLYRNYCTLHGIPFDIAEYRDSGVGGVDDSRPSTSLAMALGDLDINVASNEELSHMEQSTSGPPFNSEKDPLDDNSSGSSSPVVTMSSVHSTPTIESLKFVDTLQSLSPASSASDKAFVLSGSNSTITTDAKDYAASSHVSSSPQLSLPVPPVFRANAPANDTTASLRSKASSSNLSTSTGPRAPSFRSAGSTGGSTNGGLSASSFRKLLTGRPTSAMRGMRQISSHSNISSSGDVSTSTSITSDEPPRIIWSPPEVNL